MVRHKNKSELQDILSCGISPNPCNKYGKALLHRTCKIGHPKIVKAFLEAGARVQVSAGSGHTPLHDACGSTSRMLLETFELVLQQDPVMIHLKDTNGALPLTYVCVEHSCEWITFLESILNKYWKPLATVKPAQPPLSILPPNSRPVRDPDNAVCRATAQLVAAGCMGPSETALITISMRFELETTSVDNSISSSAWGQSMSNLVETTHSSEDDNDDDDDDEEILEDLQ